jgi:hypothetical protein
MKCSVTIEINRLQLFVVSDLVSKKRNKIRGVIVERVEIPGY